MLPRNSIRLLPEEVVHKIAAGEVVERPVSVVKELVENALDAGAKHITVKVEGGGMESMEVSDDGCGIAPDQMPLALKRHATSKIQQAEDLFSLETLGFRGEALPAIAGVSDFLIESATDQTRPLGYALKVMGGEPEDLREIPRERGTRVEVRDLFCTTPARKKFLKRPETEWGHIADLITAMAMGRLDVAWELSHRGKTFLSCPAASSPKERALDVLGREAAANLFPVQREVSELGIWGLIGHPNFSKKTNRNLFVYVNGRYVQDRLLNHAIVSGYRSLLMTGQYPMALLHLNIAPALVDVNVHPAKREIKFSNGNAIHHLISETVALALEKAPWREEGEALVFGGALERGGGSRLRIHPPSPPEGGSGATPRAGKQEVRGDGWQALYAPPKADSPQARIGILPFSKLRLIGQFHLTYLICEHEGGLILIDQHAAHERIGFERLKKSFQGGGIKQQVLLTPIVFDLNLRDREKLLRHLNDFAKFGLELEVFGEKSFALKAVPTLLPKGDFVALIRELLEGVEAQDVQGPWEEVVDHCLATMACHRQIRAGDRLEPEEMGALLQDLEGTPRSYHCPHGRPVMVEISKSEIEKWFKRVL